MERFGPQKGKWWFRIMHEHTLTLDQMARNIQSGSALTTVDVQGAVIALRNQIRTALTRGSRVRIDGIGTLELSAKGLSDSRTARLDPQQLDIVFRPDPGLRSYVRAYAEQKRVASGMRLPAPLQFTDAASKRSDAYTAGVSAKLYGHTLKFDPDDPDQGVFFVNEEGDRTRATVYIHVADRWVYFDIPAELEGPQMLLVRAQPRFAPKVRQGWLDQKLEPA
jgi:predicted histone-like DNA-binding protein